jgi:diguanylate cyclase (GGDEF)-like protein
VGDQVLVRLAELIFGNIRETDVFARLGGEEFAILAPNCDLSCACQFAEKLRGVVERHAFPDVDRLTCSFGVAGYRDGDGQDTLVKRADEALYCAKGEGRNRVVIAAS